MQGLNTTVGIDLLLTLLLVSVRAVAFLMLAPPFASRSVNGRVKAMLALALALPLAGDPRLRAQVPAAEPAALATAVVQQVLVGAALGFFCALVFAAVQAAGDMIDLFGGFQMASAYDPLSQNQTAIFGKLYNWTATALLVLSGGHLLVLKGFLRTYEVLPLNAGISLDTLVEVLTTGVAELMLSALQIAAPLVAVLFIADIGLGLLSRIAPALNVFAMSFPLKILVTLTLGGFALSVLPRVVGDSTGTMAETVVRLVGGGA